MTFLRNILLLSIMWVLLFTSCSAKKTDESPVIAQVGETKLTLNDLKYYLPKNASFTLSETQIERFLQRWIETELIYQQALRNDLGAQSDIDRKLKDAERDVL